MKESGADGFRKGSHDEEVKGLGSDQVLLLSLRIMSTCIDWHLRLFLWRTSCHPILVALAFMLDATDDFGRKCYHYSDWSPRHDWCSDWRPLSFENLMPQKTTHCEVYDRSAYLYDIIWRHAHLAAIFFAYTYEYSLNRWMRRQATVSAGVVLPQNHRIGPTSNLT